MQCSDEDDTLSQKADKQATTPNYSDSIMATALTTMAKVAVPRAFSSGMRRFGRTARRGVASSALKRVLSDNNCQPRGQRANAIIRTPLRGITLRSRPSLTDPWFSANSARSLENMLAAMDRLMFDDVPGFRNALTQVRPAWEVKETDDAFHLRFEMPGLSKEEVIVKIEDGKLIVTGEHKSVTEEVHEDQKVDAKEGAEAKDEQGDAKAAEESNSAEAAVAKTDPETKQLTWSTRSSKKYQTVLTLPENVVADKIEGEMKNGVLSLKVPKAAEEKPAVLEVPIN